MLTGCSSQPLGAARGLSSLAPIGRRYLLFSTEPYHKNGVWHESKGRTKWRPGGGAGTDVEEDATMETAPYWVWQKHSTIVRPLSSDELPYLNDYTYRSMIEIPTGGKQANPGLRSGNFWNSDTSASAGEHRWVGGNSQRQGTPFEYVVRGAGRLTHSE